MAGCNQGGRAATAAQTVAMETYARHSFNYLCEMVDKDAQPYFNIFWTTPAEAAHDWPDFGDVMSRQFQAAIMARCMTGQQVGIASRWREKLESYLDPATGLLFRPKTHYSKHVADSGDQALTLYALATAFADQPEPAMERRIHTMVETLLGQRRSGKRDDLNGFILKSLMAAGRYAPPAAALELAGMVVSDTFIQKPEFLPGNTLRQGAHMHSSLRTLLGTADYAIYMRDAVLLNRINELYRHVRSLGTRFGFLPEVVGRRGDVISCETCALMDYIGLGVTLANHGHPEYWGDVERTARNHLIESQLADGSWLVSDPSQPDTAQFTWRDIDRRMLGGYAGWTSPNHFLAAQESLKAHWGGPELKNKVRAFQNCCGGSGTHALFIVWKNAARFFDDCLYVNMHLDKLLPQAEIRCLQPYRGELTIRLKQDCRVHVRVPDFAGAADIHAESDRGGLGVDVRGNYLDFGRRPAADLITLTYPLEIREEESTVGNPGFKQYRYRVTWKGDTVVRMQPLENSDATGYSDSDQCQVPIYYGAEGPGPLYRRDQMLQDISPEPARIHLDRGALDFWFLA